MAVSPIPPGMHSISPHLVVRDSLKAIDFYKRAFGAVVLMRMDFPDGRKVMHAELKIGDSILFLADEFPGSSLGSPEKLGGSTVAIHLYVPDADATYKQAVEAGATAVMPVAQMFWGDRFGKVTDPFGHSWSIATRVEEVSPAEMARRIPEAMKQMGRK